MIESGFLCEIGRNKKADKSFFRVKGRLVNDIKSLRYCENRKGFCFLLAVV